MEGEEGEGVGRVNTDIRRVNDSDRAQGARSRRQAGDVLGEKKFKYGSRTLEMRGRGGNGIKMETYI